MAEPTKLILAFKTSCLSWSIYNNSVNICNKFQIHLINSYHHWNVDPGVRFARDVELVALILRESSEPGGIVIKYYYT